MAQDEQRVRACADCGTLSPRNWETQDLCNACYCRLKRRDDPGRYRAYMRKYAERNREKRRAQSREWRKKNAERRREYQRQYQTANPHVHRADNHKRRAKKLNATPPWADHETTKAFIAKCPEGYVIDHVVPLQGSNVCGLHVHWNLAYLSPADNGAKKNKFDPGAYQEWLRDPSVTMFLGDRVVPIGGPVIATPGATPGSNPESTDVIGETPCQKK
jgi:hypothetical protein